MKTIKQLSLLLLSIILILGVCGCMNTGVVSNSEKKNMQSYLQNKYSSDFSFVSEEDDVWSSKSKSYVFVDDNENRFLIRNSSGYLTDNYSSVLFDSIASKNACVGLGPKVKVYIKTTSTFFDSTKKFDGFMTYLSECPVINVAVYTAENYDNDELANRLKESLIGCTASVVIYHVADGIFASVNDFVSDISTISSVSFWIENNSISEKSWEE